jgi:hypothetical protein
VLKSGWVKQGELPGAVITQMPSIDFNVGHANDLYLLAVSPWEEAGLSEEAYYAAQHELAEQAYFDSASQTPGPRSSTSNDAPARQVVAGETAEALIGQEG